MAAEMRSEAGLPKDCMPEGKIKGPTDVEPHKQKERPGGFRHRAQGKRQGVKAWRFPILYSLSDR